MDQMQLSLVQRKIAIYPEKISKLQDKQNLIKVPSADDIPSAIKGINAYLLFLRANYNSFIKLKEEIQIDSNKLEGYINNLNNAGEKVSESLQLSLIQANQAMASIQTYIDMTSSQIDNGEVVKEKLSLAQKQKESIDIANLLLMIKKGDGYNYE